MTIEHRAIELAQSGRYKDERAVIWALFKEGYGDADWKIGFLARRRLARLCAAANSSAEHG